MFRALVIITLGLASFAGAEDHGGAVSAIEALRLLQEGNRRFVTGVETHAQSDLARAKELAGGQKPVAIVLSCSDSRVPPELIFDQGIGRLFAVRVAGNVLGAEETASIEYALEHLGTKLVVVLGHDRCGAVKAAVETKYGSEGPTEDLTALIRNIHRNLGPALERFAEAKAEDPTLEGASRANALAVVRGLQDRSKVVFEGLKSGAVQVVPAIYHLATGEVEFLVEKKRGR